MDTSKIPQYIERLKKECARLVAEEQRRKAVAKQRQTKRSFPVVAIIPEDDEHFFEYATTGCMIHLKPEVQNYLFRYNSLKKFENDWVGSLADLKEW